MKTPPKRLARVCLAVVVLLSGGAVLSSYATAEPNLAQDRPSTGTTDGPGYGSVPVPMEDGVPRQPNGTGVDGEPSTLDLRTNRTTLDPDDDVANVTVVATQGFYISDEQAELVAFSRDGDVVYYDDTYRVYFDVDPVPGRAATVEYTASRHLNGEDCAAVSTERCTYNVFRRVNLTTGVDREIYGEVTPRIVSARWHDVDRLNETHVVVADIVRDSVRVVDARTDETTWRWHASGTYDRSQGGQEGDWTHVNDVEVLEDGRIMASVRNMDQVVFLEPGEGVQPNWTLGDDEDYDVLYEQHNPDYVPPSMGGPAITVADSENGRVLEYQRVDPDTGNATTASDGEWRRTWGWRDSRLQWPRDVDRLPGNTSLVSDTHGDRVVEVAPDGRIVWSVTVGMPYEAERLGTGDESAGGRSMAAIRAGADVTPNGSSGPFSSAAADADGDATTVVRPPEGGVVQAVWVWMKDVVPSLPVNGVLFAGPYWLRFPDVVFGLVCLATGITWVAVELRWTETSLRSQVRTVYRRFSRA